MKTLVLMLIGLTLTISGCTRNVNQTRGRDDRREQRRLERDKDQRRPDRDDRDRRPNGY